MKFTFIKLPNHRRFNPQTIYYYESKYERKERERRIREELGLSPTDEEDAGNFEDRIRGRMRRRIKSSFEIAHSERRKSNIRLIIILIALMALFYYLLQAGYEWYSRFM